MMFKAVNLSLRKYVICVHCVLPHRLKIQQVYCLYVRTTKIVSASKNCVSLQWCISTITKYSFVSIQVLDKTEDAIN